jgi:hypothetical protein
VPLALLYIVLAIVAFYLIAGVVRYLRQEWKRLAARIGRLLRGGDG